MKINEIISNIDKKHRQTIILGLIGLIQGALILYGFDIIGEFFRLIREAPPDFPLEEKDIYTTIIVYYTFICLGIFFFQFNYNERDTIKLTVISITISLVLASCIHQLVSGTKENFLLFINMPFIIYMIMPFVQIYHQSNKLYFPYTELFLHAWNNIFVFSIALLFYSLFWLLLSLWVFSFEVIDIVFFRRVFWSKEFILIVGFAVFGIGIAIGKDSKNIIATLRNIMLAMSKLLTPILILFFLVFFIAIVFYGLKILLEIKYSSAFLLTMVAATIFFFNGIYQDGDSKPPYPKWLNILLETTLLIMPIYAIYILYAIGIRISQYGLTPSRFWMLFWGLVAMCYAIGYAISVIMRKGKWMYFVSKVNVSMALVIIFALLLTYTPISNPTTLSAYHQYHRLASGAVDAEEFNYGYMYFKLGKTGKDSLKKIATLQLPKQAFINEQIEYLQSFTSIWSWNKFQNQKELFNKFSKGRVEAMLINETIDYEFLHLRAGKAGKQLLNKYLTLKNHPQYNMLKQKIEEARRNNR